MLLFLILVSECLQLSFTAEFLWKMHLEDASYLREDLEELGLSDVAIQVTDVQRGVCRGLSGGSSSTSGRGRGGRGLGGSNSSRSHCWEVGSS